jgi:pimeloyl-ACP methyl ester carboxylesterase
MNLGRLAVDLVFQRPFQDVDDLLGRLAGDLTRDDVLDNITLYWLTNTGISAARLYWENKADIFDAKNITIPFAIRVFPDELYQAPRSWAERAYPDNLIYYNTLDRGGHFAAWEQPELFAAEMRASFRSLRQPPCRRPLSTRSRTGVRRHGPRPDRIMGISPRSWDNVASERL